MSTSLSSVSGLVSGLDTASIINQLMQVEAQPRTNLKNRVSAEQKVVTALQAINAKLAGVATKAGDLAKAASWSPLTATSDNAGVTATTSAGATPATLTLDVLQTATASVLDLGVHAATDQVLSDGSTLVSLTRTDGTTVTVDTVDGTYGGLVKAVNSGGYGVTATMVQVSTGSYRVQLTATDTGAKTIGLAAPSGSTATLTSPPVLTQGQQAQITVGPDTIVSDSNTFTGLMQGVDVTLAPGATGTATVTVARDSAAMADSVKALVDAVNSVLDDIDAQTGYDPATKKSGPLAGESLLRGLEDRLVGSVADGIGGKTLATVGVQVDRYGKLVFDESAFKAAYDRDPAGTSAMFTDAGTSGGVNGLASQLASIATSASDPVNGTLTLAIQGHSSSIRSMNDSIADWDVRLTAKQQALQMQFANLEVALGKLQDQASWLSGQISSLPTGS